MKVAIVLSAIVAVVLAEPPVPNSQYLPSNQYGAPRPFGQPSNQYGPPSHTAAILNPSTTRPGGDYLPPNNERYSQNGGYNNNGGYGQNQGYDDRSEPANYNFEYHVQDAASGNDFGHEESRQGDVAQGKYYVLLPDGRRQTVEYVADNDGFKPKISYEQVNNGIGNGYNNGGYQQGRPGGYQSARTNGYQTTDNGANGATAGYEY